MCRALILCDTKAGPDENEAKIKRWRAIEMLKNNRAEFVDTQWQALVGKSSAQNADLKLRFNELVAKVADKGIVTGLMALATRTDSSSVLEKIKVPTLILVGDEDLVTPVSDSSFLAKSIPNSQFKILEQTGHLSNLESPMKFNDHLADFLLSLS